MASMLVSGGTSGSITISAPAVSGTNTLTLPVATDTLVGLAATQTLTNKTLTSPVLTTPNLGTPSTLVLTNATGLAAASLPAGSVLQVVSANMTSALAMGMSGWTSISGWAATITPSSTSNKVLVLGFCGAVSGASNTQAIRILRGATAIAVGDASGSRSQATTRGARHGDSNHTYSSSSFSCLDSPSSSSAVTYQIQGLTEGNSTLYINRSQNDTDTFTYGARTCASLTLMEIKA